jgi:hypothetical protein
MNSSANRFLFTLGHGRATGNPPDKSKVFCCFFSKKQRFLAYTNGHK